MFGIGPVELLVMVVVAIILLGIPLAILVGAIVLLRRRNSSNQRDVDLRAENERLRDEVGRLGSGRG